jgi:hypothetical protein
VKRIFLIAGFSVALAANGQSPSASQQVESVQQRRQLEQAAQPLMSTNSVPELYAGESSDVGPQYVLQIKPRRIWVEASGDVQYFYSDNVLLSEHNKVNADVLVSTVSAAIAPTAFKAGDGLLAPRLGYQQEWFTYDPGSSKQISSYDFSSHQFKRVDLDQLDFNVMTIFSDVSWTWQNWTLTIGADFDQYLDSGDYQEFYKEFVARWAVRHDFSPTVNTLLSIGYEGDYRLTDTPNTPPQTGSEFNDRTDHSLVIVGSWRMCRYAILQPSYRFQVTHFTTIDRDDILNSFGLALYCPVTDWITFRAFVTYDIFNTDGSYANNYNKLDVGGGINLTVQF